MNSNAILFSLGFTIIALIIGFILRKRKRRIRILKTLESGCGEYERIISNPNPWHAPLKTYKFTDPLTGEKHKWTKTEKTEDKKFHTALKIIYRLHVIPGKKASFSTEKILLLPRGWLRAQASWAS